MKRLLYILLILGKLTIAAPVTTITADIYDQAAEPRTLLHKFTRTEESSGAGKKIVTRVWFDLSGKEVSRETVQYTGDKVSLVELNQLQLGESGTVKFASDKAHFEYSKNGKITKDSEKVTPDLITSDQVVPFVHAHWDKILSGDTLPIRLTVMNRNETVGFKFFKIKEDTLNGKPVVHVKMKPSSMLIAALVDPLIFIFNKDGDRKLQALEGRVSPLMKKNGDSWKDLDGYTVYHHPK